MFKTTADKSANYSNGNSSEAVCTGPSKHTAYKKPGASGSNYKCPYCGYSLS